MTGSRSRLARRAGRPSPRWAVEAEREEEDEPHD